MTNGAEHISCEGNCFERFLMYLGRFLLTVWTVALKTFRSVPLLLGEVKDFASFSQTWVTSPVLASQLKPVHLVKVESEHTSSLSSWRSYMYYQFQHTWVFNPFVKYAPGSLSVEVYQMNSGQGLGSTTVDNSWRFTQMCFYHLINNIYGGYLGDLPKFP